MPSIVDYIISGHDRHLNNLGVLRDAESLEFVRLAPIFDSGDAFFTGRAYPATNKEWLLINVNGFCSLERDMISKVTDFNRVDLSKLPSNSFLKELYGKDTKASAYVTEQIIACYEKKIDMLSDLQHGNDPYKIMY